MDKGNKNEVGFLGIFGLLARSNNFTDGVKQSFCIYHKVCNNLVQVCFPAVAES